MQQLQFYALIEWPQTIMIHILAETKTGRVPTGLPLLQSGGAPPNKILRWADEVAPVEGFTIGGPASQQVSMAYLCLSCWT